MDHKQPMTIQLMQNNIAMANKTENGAGTETPKSADNKPDAK